MLQRVRFTLLSICLLSFEVVAETYQFEDQEGTLWFTDRPMMNTTGTHYQPVRSATRKQSKNTCVPNGSGSYQRRIANYHPLIKKLAQQNGVHEYLIHAMVSTESCYDTHAVSAAGAQGLMQLMPATARELGVEDPFDPEQNLKAGISYFSKLQRRFDYNSQFALAAYNAGPATVEKYNGLPPFKETRAYVDRVLKKYREYTLSPTSLFITGSSVNH